MADRRSVLISANPRSGPRSGLEQARALQVRLEQSGYRAELVSDIQAMTERAAQLHASGDLRTVVSAGGDGTASLVLSKIPLQVPVTLFPLGSENLLAKYFGMTRDVERTVQAIDDLRTVPLDLFRANGQSTLLVTSVGFDAEVVRQVHENRRSQITRWAYRWAILRAIASYRWPRFRIEILGSNGEWSRAGECNWLFAFNVARYAAGIAIIDQTPIDDGLLEVGMFDGGGLLQGLWNYAKVVLGVHHRSKHWKRLRVAGLRVCLAADDHSFEPASRGTPRSVPADASFQIDGDWGGSLPLEIVHSGRQAQIVVDRDFHAEPARVASSSHS